ncbi:MAG: DKNYY domain-containing protein [Agriterribacter sp.]
MTKTNSISLLILLFWTTSCKEQKQNEVQRNNEITGTDLAQFELKDSSLLTHIKGQFYKSKSGQLFERTFAEREVQGVDTLVSVEYFNGKLPQEIDPLTFEQLDGWFAKDKNAAYYYRPTSGGMLCVKLDSADSKNFQILSGQYLYAVDNRHVFKETEILENIDPQKMKITKDKDNKIIKIQSGQTTYVAD